jgi:hypothetical protein
MDKLFKVTLKFLPNAERYQVTKIIGPKVMVAVRQGNTVTVGQYLTLEMTDILGERAVLTTT